VCWPWTLLLSQKTVCRLTSLCSQTGYQPYVFRGVNGYGDGTRSMHLCDVCQELPASWGIAASDEGESLPHTYIHIDIHVHM